MSFVSISVGDIIGYTWHGVNAGYYVCPHARMSKADTFLAIFSRTQHNALACLLASDKVTVLFKSNEARNTTPGHGFSRNTLVVFELNEDPALPKVQKPRK